MKVIKHIMVLSLVCIPSFVMADWAMVPDLNSRELWQLVSENRAEVVSSVGFGDPTSRHEKQTVFIIKEAKKSEGNIKWAINPDGSYSSVMCTETWDNTYKYSHSACYIPGCIPDNQECLDEVFKNFKKN